MIGVTCATLLLGVVVLWFFVKDTQTDELATVATPATAMPMPTQAIVPVEATTLPVPANAAMPADALAVPKDVSPQKWNKIVASLASHPNKAKELQRIADFLTFSNQLDTWRASKEAGMPSAQRAVLTQKLLDELPVHVSRNEMIAPEAMLIAVGLLGDTTSDPAMLKEALAKKAEQIKASDVKLDAATAKAQTDTLALYKQKEAAILLEWQSLPTSQQDPKVLEKRLQEARVDVFDTVKK